VPGMTPLQDRSAADTEAIAAYNEQLKNDPRFFTTWLPVGDGVSISTKVQPT
jgi:predicted O-methyltransferase YrrM